MTQTQQRRVLHLMRSHGITAWSDCRGAIIYREVASLNGEVRYALRRMASLPSEGMAAWLGY